MRSKSVKLVSSSSMSIEVELVEGSFMGSVDNTIYCCVAKGKDILYSYNSKERELEGLAVLCLEHAPPYHKWYFHTVGTRTFGYLMMDGYIYFAIVDPTVGNVGILWFLEQVRDGFKKVAKNGYHNELVPVIKRLIESLEKMPQSAILLDDHNNVPINGECSMSTEAPLLGKHHDKRRMKERVSEIDETVEEHCDRGIHIDVATDSVDPMQLQRSLSQTRLLAQKMARKVWWRHVKIVIIVDIIICFIFFIVWLAVCRGFHCVS